MTNVLRLGMFGLVVLASTAYAAGQMGSPTAACGDGKAKFEVTQGPGNQEVKVPAAGKAQLYLIQVGALAYGDNLGRPTIRQGMDGAWMGATQGFTFVRSDVEVGVHHLCSQWQSHFAGANSEIALNSFTAEAGKTYYFRAQITIKAGPGGR